VLVSSTGQSSPMRAQLRVEVMAPTRESAQACLAGLRRGVRERNVYRGRVISLDQEPYGPVTVRVHTLPRIERDEIILPGGVLDRVERHTITFATHVEKLRDAGQHAKRGLLLHGPPGTGKTLTAKYVAGQMPDRTVIILTGASLALIAEAAAVARLLQPSMLIVEDVDLIAEERTHERASTSLLFELLNQLDGMEEDADVVFLLTTNRPDLLEPALAARPGRVDLAVEIPLPDELGRQRLLELYSRGIPLEVHDLDHVVARTRGVSAAFIRELVRKAALAAADEEGALRITDGHLDDALQELLFEGGELTRSLLGGPSSHAGS
jgi:ATP-dependent 26S proteasome regulatory subunit